MSKLIHLFTIGLYLFDTLLSILVLKKEYNQENKQIKNNMNIFLLIIIFNCFLYFIHYDIQLLCYNYVII
uniref:Uncharacterized protein n=1 Tax=Fagonia indica TaxID=66629 RepID=A0A6C0UA73_9ROSI|nr:hypothetical protein [Fagonia indica]